MLGGMDVPGALERVVTALRGAQVEHALIGLKVQSSTNDPSRQRLDMADIVRLLRAERNVDMQRVREYFRVFEREKELDVLPRGAGEVVTREDLEEMRRDADSAEIRAEFRRSARAVLRWERDHPQDLVAVLAWIEQLRRLFGDPEPDREPWRGENFRL